MAIAMATGPISFARKTEVGINVLSLRRHDPDQVQRVPAVLGRVSQLPTGAPLGTLLNVCPPAPLSTHGWLSFRVSRAHELPVSRTRCSAQRCTADAEP